MVTPAEATPVHRPLNAIAQDTLTHWPKAPSQAKRALTMLLELGSVRDYYKANSAADLIQTVLANARHWRGAQAQTLKAELRAWLAEKPCS